MAEIVNKKLALTAGHYLGTAGKRCLASLDPNTTKEWVLNDRICDKIEKLLAEYDGIEIIRTDDTTGKTEVTLAERASKANKAKADFYLSIHHNAGIEGGTGGGIVAYTYTEPSKQSIIWQTNLYNALIDATGLKGNRSIPLAKSNLYECREVTMPAVLLELGFMDSKTDVPIILTDDYADKCANAIVSVIVDTWALTKKHTEPPKAEPPKVEPLAGNIPNATLVKLLRMREQMLTICDELGEILGVTE